MIPQEGEEETDYVDACVCVGVDAGASQSADKAEGARWLNDLAMPGTGYRALSLASLDLFKKKKTDELNKHHVTLNFPTFSRYGCVHDIITKVKTEIKILHELYVA